MKWEIKYEDYYGEVHIETIWGYSKQDAVDQLFFCKEVYWINPIPIIEIKATPHEIMLTQRLTLHPQSTLIL